MGEVDDQADLVNIRKHGIFQRDYQMPSNDRAYRTYAYTIGSNRRMVDAKGNVYYKRINGTKKVYEIVVGNRRHMFNRAYAGRWYFKGK